MLDLANAYLRMWSKLEYIDLWYSPPATDAAKRVASQQWHRDFNDRHLLKAFLYLVDVDEETGPFEYVAGSARGGPYADDWPWRPLSESYPPQDELAKRIPRESIKTFTAPKGTIIFCNTSGFHRGGFATGRARVLATATYSSPASLASLTERNYSTPEANGLDPTQRHALS
jgi:ectoine hydroxylase-related dioxygenase (phytanoyl-CoA dioxygenase family)